MTSMRRNITGPITDEMDVLTIFLGQLEGDKIVQDKALIIPFQESEACLSTITTKVKEALAIGADENIILTDSQGNLLLDSPGTKGSSYWKQSSRRFFAIKDVFAEMGRRRKRRKLGQAKRHEESELLEIRDKIEEVLLASEGLPAVSAKLRELSKHSEGLTEQQSEILKTSFRCNVCRGVMNSPMLARCCRSLVGCRECVNAILQEGQGCVKCRSPITEESLVAVAGLSEVFNIIRAIEEQYTSV
ncbi:uncharacterized protein LOC132847758 [Tachysurus vachellii]|uniref:uncharacterized protein LOC132847758 n=1 Tax=Tachysurus vachellii TaxID=175792 RepID=UPI00296A9480|nr:uncharacterized protein LOC132847758 [Tachysurus vachellii]